MQQQQPALALAPEPMLVPDRAGLQAALARVSMIPGMVSYRMLRRDWAAVAELLYAQGYVITSARSVDRTTCQVTIQRARAVMAAPTSQQQQPRATVHDDTEGDIAAGEETEEEDDDDDVLIVRPYRAADNDEDDDDDDLFDVQLLRDAVPAAAAAPVPRPAQRAAPWTPQDDLRLLELVRVHGRQWIRIAHVLGRRRNACLVRYTALTRPNATARWAADEVRRFELALQRWRRAHPGQTPGGQNNAFAVIATAVITRDRTQCRDKYAREYTGNRSLAQAPLSEREQQLLRTLFQHHGPRWRTIADELAQRSGGEMLVRRWTQQHAP